MSYVERWVACDRDSTGRKFEFRQRLLCTKANSAFHPSPVDKWIVAYVNYGGNGALRERSGPVRRPQLLAQVLEPEMRTTYRRKTVRRSGPGQDTVEKQQATGRRNLANRFVLTRGPMADNVVLRYRLVQLVDRIELAKREGRGFEFCSCSIGDGSLSCTPALRPGRSLVAQCVIPENSERSVSSVLSKCMRGLMT